MNRCELPDPLRGIVPPMATPLRDRDSLDRPGLERLVEHILAGGVNGLFVLGTTGEAPGLSHRLQREVVESVCAQVDGRVPVLAGISDTSFAESLELARYAARAGACAVVATPPYYFPPDQQELLAYIRRLAAELPLPLFLYNMPSLAKVAFEPETVLRAAEIPGVVGLKDSSGDMDYFGRICRLVAGKPGFSLLLGPEGMLAEAVFAGADGGVCGGANIHPRLYVDLYRAAASGDRPEAARLQERVRALGDGIFWLTSSSSSYLRGLKCALACLGLCRGILAPPYESYGPAEEEKVRRALFGLGLLQESALHRDGS